jgi:hypothetical protein
MLNQIIIILACCVAAALVGGSFIAVLGGDTSHIICGAIACVLCFIVGGINGWYQSVSFN